MNQRRRKSSNSHIFGVILLIVILVAVIAYMLVSNKKMNTLESFVKDCSVSVQRVLYKPLKEFSTMIGDFFKLRDVQEENKILKSNIEKIESLESENMELKDELNKLKSELNIEHVLSDYDYLNATVVSRNALYWYSYLTIDKGSHNGIKEGMVVINSTGLIGRIENVSTFSADVKLITTTNANNNKISVAVTNGEHSVNGIITGYNHEKNLLSVEGISNTEIVSIGDMVYTSGLGGAFPSGVLIGKVENITTDVYDLVKIIQVKPSANFRDINYVTVLKRKDLQ